MPHRTDTQRFDELATEIDDLFSEPREAHIIDAPLLSISIAKLENLQRMATLAWDGPSLRREIDEAVKPLVAGAWSEGLRNELFSEIISTLGTLTQVGGGEPLNEVRLRRAAEFLRMVVVGFQKYISKVHHR